VGTSSPSSGRVAGALAKSRRCLRGPDPLPVSFLKDEPVPPASVSHCEVLSGCEARGIGFQGWQSCHRTEFCVQEDSLPSGVQEHLEELGKGTQVPWGT
jgi:hypothetical protein